LADVEKRRKEQSDVVLPLFPLLVEIAQLRKQATERLAKEFRRQRDRAKAGEIELPYQFQYVDRHFSVSEHATALSEVQLIEREALYRGVLFATALATLSLTNGSRLSELLQVSASRFETLIVDELKNQHPTGRKIGILVQSLLPKGYTHESERQYFLISDM